MNIMYFLENKVARYFSKLFWEYAFNNAIEILMIKLIEKPCDTNLSTDASSNIANLHSGTDHVNVNRSFPNNTL